MFRTTHLFCLILILAVIGKTAAAQCAGSNNLQLAVEASIFSETMWVEEEVPAVLVPEHLDQRPPAGRAQQPPHQLGHQPRSQDVVRGGDEPQWAFRVRPHQ